jgi:hypothetical protein
MLRYRQDDERRRIDVLASGRLTLDEATRFVDRQHADGGWSYGVVYDLCDLHENLSPADAATLALYIVQVSRSHPPRGPVAVVTGTAKMHEIAETYADLGRQAAGLRVAVFDRVPDAEHWLTAQGY